MDQLTSFVAAESTTTTSSACRCCGSLRSRSVSGSIALDCPGGSLINDLHRWLGLLVRVFIVIIAYFSPFVSRVVMHNVLIGISFVIPRSSYRF